MRGLLVALIVFGSLPMCFMQPYIGLLMWAWLGYMNPHRLTWGFAYDFPFVLVVATVTMAGMLVSRERKKIPWTPVTVVWLILILWMSFTTLFALVPHAAFGQWKEVIKIQIMIAVTLMLFNTRERLTLLVWDIVVSIGFFGVKGGVFTILTGGHYRVWGPPGSFIAGNNEMALALLILIPLMRYLQMYSSNKWVRRGLVVAMILTGLSIVGSYSRGAFLGGAVMVFMLWLKSKRKLAVAIPLALAAGVVLAFMPAKYYHRIDSIEHYKHDKSALGRINAWHFAVNLANHRPIVGGGFKTFTPSLFEQYAPEPKNYHDSHSIYFEMLGEQGYVGLGLFLLLWLLTFRSGRWIIRKTRGHPDLQWAQDLARMLQVGLTGFAVSGAFLGLAYWDLPYHYMSIMVLTRMIVEKELAARRASESVASPDESALLTPGPEAAPVSRSMSSHRGLR